MKKALLSLLLVAVCSLSSFASHYSGGEILYKWNGTNYTVTLKLYTPCLPQIFPMADSMNIVVRSASQNFRKIITVRKIQEENIVPQCSVQNSCADVTASYTSFKVFTFQDTISLSGAASDWVFHWHSNARQVTSNLTTSGGVNSANIYIEATLDNTTGENSIAYTPTTLPLMASFKGAKLHMQTLDYDGDSLVFETISPMVDSARVVDYANLYSPTNPLGSGVTYTVDGQYITLGNTAVQGYFTLAYRVKEYRNGKMIASRIREFVAGYIFGQYPEITRPVLKNGVTEVYVCPGKTQSFRLEFTDTLADSVFVMIDTPITSTWPFLTIPKPGKGTATLDVNFTAPASLNPQTLPFFYIDVLVYDNACPRNATKYAVLVKTRLCNTDSVWAGDANSDKVVDLLDPLAVAISYGKTGFLRTGASTAWVPQFSIDWSANIPYTATDNKHADCNGDGQINSGDLGAIATNWSKTHNKGDAQYKATAATELYFDISGIAFVPGATVNVPIKLRGNTINNYYGFSTEVGMTLNASIPSSQIIVTPSTSWLGNSSNTIDFNKPVNNGKIAWAFARNNQTGVSGNGTVGTLTFTIPVNAQNGDRVDMTFRSTTMIDATGRVLDDYSAKDAVAYIWPVTVKSFTSSLGGVAIVPNPSQGNATLQISLAEAQQVNVTVTDITGKSIWANTASLEKGNNQIALPAAELPSGVYMVRIASGAGISTTLKWVKQ